jgi:H+/Cl- antiporter ClcA
MPALVGGVSLGTENPITAANIALACAVGVRIAGKETTPLWLVHGLSSGCATRS